MQVAHIANIGLSDSSGMGRIALEWKKAFEKKGHNFVHIDENIAGRGHPLLFGMRAVDIINKKNFNIDLLLLHEPTAGFFTGFKQPKVVFSHGIEQRAWQLNKQFNYNARTFRSRLLPEHIRFSSNNKGFRHADVILLSNKEDEAYLNTKIPETSSKVRIFRNGYYDWTGPENEKQSGHYLFNASWIPRKGIELLSKAFNRLMAQYKGVKLTIAAGGTLKQTILESFEPGIRQRLEVISPFSKEMEMGFYRDASIFVMPSYFEGQSLALTQAMAMGLCPVAAQNSGQIDLITHGFNGLLFETGNLDAFYSQLEFAFLNPAKVNDMAKCAAKSVEHFTWETAGREIVEWCESLI